MSESLPALNGAVLDPDAQIDREYISTKGGAFSVDEKQIGDIDMIVLAAAPTRSLFLNAYVPDQEAFPDCFAVGKGGVPSVNSPLPQSPDCISCPHSQWENGKPPRCKERRKLVGIRVIDGKINPRLSVVNVPPTSVMGTKKNPGGWRKYLGGLGVGNFKIRDVITTIQCRSNAPSPGYRLEFKNKGPTAAVEMDPAILVGFQAMAAMEALLEPKPKDDVEADVVAEAQKNTESGKASVKAEAKKPKF